MNIFSDVKSVRTYKEIIEQIVNGIRKGKLEPKEKLPSERELSRILGVGRQCIREALSVLEASKIIEAKKGSGTFIHPEALINLDKIALESEEVDDPFALIEARKIIEKETAALAAKMYQPSDATELDEIAQNMTRAISNQEHAGELDKQLHLTIAKISRNPVYYKIMSDLIANMGKKLWLMLKERSLLVEGRTQRYYFEHMLLIQAIKDKDYKLAEKIMLQHITGVEHDLKN